MPRPFVIFRERLRRRPIKKPTTNEINAKRIGIPKKDNSANPKRGVLISKAVIDILIKIKKTAPLINPKKTPKKEDTKENFNKEIFINLARTI